MPYRTNLLDYLEDSAARCPNKIAFTDESCALTFAALRREAMVLAGLICRATPRTNSPIGVMAGRTVETLVGFFAALYSGNFYAPLDRDMPAQRLQQVLQTLAPTLILTTEADASRTFPCPTLPMSQRKNAELDEALLCVRRGEILDIDPAYCIFTSGSTGIPKGIAVAHRSVIDFIEWLTETCDFTAADVMGNQAPFYFDCSVKDIYLTLKCGATTHILPKKLFLFPKLLMDFLREKEVTSLVWATSGFNLVANSGALAGHAPQCLKKVVVGGEAMLARQLNVWRHALPHVRYVNLYGPTEVTVDCCYYKVERDFADHEAVPIGAACANKQVLLLDEQLRPVARGERGEICVRGTGLALGYYNEPEKTAAAFVQNPANTHYPDLLYRTGDIGVVNENGELVFQSRRDGQIKHMGYRIELGEIERAIASCPAVDEAVCLFDAPRDRIVCSFSGTVEGAEIIVHLRTLLPKYMFPNVFCRLPALPHNANGKIDRPALKRRYDDEKSTGL